MKTSKEFYTELTPEKLAERKKKIHTQKELTYLRKFLDKKDKILDLACGYGRFTIPLRENGYNIEGIDITPSLIKKAKEDSKNKNLNIKFRVGDMRNLPYKNNSFDKIICMWSAFIELTNEKDQIKAIKEMKRVLISGGLALIEMPPIVMKKEVVNDKKFGDKFTLDKDTKILRNVILSNIKAMPTRRHNKKSLINLMNKCRIKKYKIFVDKFGGRERFFLQFRKN